MTYTACGTGLCDTLWHTDALPSVLRRRRPQFQVKPDRSLEPPYWKLCGLSKARCFTAKPTPTSHPMECFFQEGGSSEFACGRDTRTKRLFRSRSHSGPNGF